MRIALLPLLAMLAAVPAFGQEASTATGKAAAISTEDAPLPASTAKKASSHHRRTAKQRFEEANTSHDGKLTLEQARTAKMTRVAKNFEAIDAGHKGYVTLAEVKAYNKAQRAAKKAAQ